jgi:hypothetical protein
VADEVDRLEDLVSDAETLISQAKTAQEAFRVGDVAGASGTISGLSTVLADIQRGKWTRSSISCRRQALPSPKDLAGRGPAGTRSSEAGGRRRCHAYPNPDAANISTASVPVVVAVVAACRKVSCNATNRATYWAGSVREWPRNP